MTKEELLEIFKKKAKKDQEAKLSDEIEVKLIKKKEEVKKDEEATDSCESSIDC